MNVTTNIRCVRLPLLLAGLTLAAALAGCATPPASSEPTSQPLPTARPTAAPQPTQPAPQPTAVPPTQPAPQSTQPAPQPTAVPPPTQPAPTDTAGAVQTVLNYYDAIVQRQFDRAYGYWANNGAASNQTLDQFKQGFANTAGIDLRLRSPVARGADVTIPVTLTAVINSASGTGDQLVQHFSGTYTLRPDSGSDTGWRIAAANIAEGPSSPPAPPPADPNGAVQTLQEYYDAINRHDYAYAYTLWANLGAASKQSFAQFEQGFATTTHVVIDIGKATTEGAAGSIYAEVPVVVMSTTSDNGPLTFCGTYTLRRSNVPPFDQFGWHIESAQIAQVANVQPGSAEEQQLLNGGCKAS
ncbi:MAG: hypothetical protein ACJ8CR_35680 [Roseiflexaceae bacterium]